MPSRREQIAMNAEEAEAFLHEEKTVTCASIGREGWPHLMPLWYVLRPTGADGTPEFWAWTFAKSQKVRNLERDPRATLQVESGTEYHLLRGLMLETEVEFVRDTEAVRQLGIEIFSRYMGAGIGLDENVSAMIAKQAVKRVAMRFVERRRVSWDHRKLGGIY
jgi:general stress protein 26